MRVWMGVDEASFVGHVVPSMRACRTINCWDSWWLCYNAAQSAAVFGSLGLGQGCKTILRYCHYHPQQKLRSPQLSGQQFMQGP
jgi:hypothetical protein